MNDQDFPSTEMDDNEEAHLEEESGQADRAGGLEESESRKAKIVVKKDEMTLIEYIVERLPVSIGRKSENEIVLDERNVSRKHAQIDVKDEQYIIRDLSSSLGTKVNDKSISETDIHTGDIIEIGKYRLHFDSGIPEDERTVLDAEEETVLEEGTELDEDRTQFYEEPEVKLLVIQSENLEGEIILEDDEILIGRDEDVTITIEDKRASRQHCKIYQKDGIYVISDLGSANGTFINNRKISTEHNLQNGDKIQIGSTIFEFHVTRPPIPDPKSRVGVLLKMVLALAGIGVISFLIYKMITSPKEQKVILQSLWEYSASAAVRLSPSIGDLNGDGFNNIVVSDDAGIIVSLDGRQGGLTWNKPFSRSGVKVLTSSVLVDINKKDGELDVVVGTQSKGILAIDGSTARQIWAASLASPPTFALAAADINEDGTHDVFVGTENGQIICLDGRQGGPVWSFDTKATILSAPVLSDLSGDKIPDVIIGALNNRLLVLDGRNGKRLWVYVDTEPPSMVACAPFNKDKTPDIAVTYASKVIVLDGKKGFVIWKWLIPESARPNIEDLFIPVPPAVSDLNQDKIPDVIVSTPGGHVYAIDGVSEGVKYIWDYSLSPHRKTSPALCDLNGDNTTDIVVGDTEGVLSIIDGKTGHRLNQIKLDGSIVSPPVIGDITADGQVNMVVGTLNKKVIALQTETKIEKNHIIWGSIGGDVFNTGYIP